MSPIAALKSLLISAFCISIYNFVCKGRVCESFKPSTEGTQTYYNEGDRIPKWLKA